MSATVIVNYHINSAEPQAYHIDAGGENGSIVAPVLVPTEVVLTDLRTSGAASFKHDSVSIIYSPSQITEFDEAENWEATYDLELGSLLKQQIDAKEVIVFDHTVRIDDQHSGRKPVRNVHSDYNPISAHEWIY